MSKDTWKLDLSSRSGFFMSGVCFTASVGELNGYLLRKYGSNTTHARVSPRVSAAVMIGSLAASMFFYNHGLNQEAKNK